VDQVPVAYDRLDAGLGVPDFQEWKMKNLKIFKITFLLKLWPIFSRKFLPAQFTRANFSPKAKFAIGAKK
jgi:hypothetical protein